MIQISKTDAEGILGAIKKHEAARPDFDSGQYTDSEWNGITALVVALGDK